MSSEKEDRGIVREILSAAAKEMGFAVDSIRNEVIEKGWFERELTEPAAGEWLREGDASPETGIHGPQDFSREELYGKATDTANHDHEHDLAQEREQDLER